MFCRFELFRLLGLIATLFLIAAWPTPAPAEVPFKLAPVGDEFQVNSYTTGTQQDTDVAAHDNGFVVVWESDGSAEPEDADTMSIQAQRYDSGGMPIGGQFQVNSYTTGHQSNPAVAAWPDGRFAVVWAESRIIRGGLFSADGLRVGNEFVLDDLSALGAASVEEPDIAVNNESLLAVWESNPGPADTNFGITARRYASDGSSLGGKFQVNSVTTQSQLYPSINAAPDSGFVVTWISDATTDPSLQMRRLGSDGTPIGTDFQVNSQTGGYALDVSAVDFAADGSFVVAWTDYASPGTDSSDTAVLAKRFDSAGAAVATEFQVNTYTLGEQFLNDVAALPGGGFMVTWQGHGVDPTDPDFGVMASRFDSAGQKSGADFLINSYTTSGQFSSKIAANETGDFLVTWTSLESAGTDSNLNSVQARRYITEADVGVTKTDHVTSIVAGTQTIYEIVVSNAGPDTATGVQVVDSLPNRLTCDWTSQATSGATGNNATGSGDLMETLILPPTSTVTYTMTCDLDSGATGSLINTVGVTADQVDNNASNDSATDINSVISADLGITLQADNIGPGPGDTVVLTATVTNNGLSPATGVTVSSTLPSGLAFSSSTDCTEAAGVVTCDVGGLSVAGQASVRFTVQVDGAASFGSEILATASAAGNEGDPLSGNDLSTVTLLVTDIVLQVDITDPSAAVINPSSAASAGDIALEQAYNGVTLVGFFSGNTQSLGGAATCGSLDPLLAGSANRAGLVNVFADSFVGGWTMQDLNFHADPNFDIAFSTAAPALLGQVTQDLSQTSGLPVVGTTGLLIAGEPNAPKIIGRWQVIMASTPSNCLLFQDGFESGNTSAWSWVVP